MKVDLEEKGDEYDQVAATLRKAASARLPSKELSFVIANTEDMASLAERFKVSERAALVIVLMRGLAPPPPFARLSKFDYFVTKTVRRPNDTCSESYRLDRSNPTLFGTATLHLLVVEKSSFESRSRGRCKLTRGYG